MRDLRIPTTRPYALPRPQVSKAVVRQTVNLRPMGNTVAITTLADNPFEGGKRISVRTQMSGGMAGPDPTQQSRSIMHSQLPGMGDGPTQTVNAPAARPGSALEIFTSAINTGTDLYRTNQGRLTAEAAARAAAAQADAERYRSQGMFANMGRHSSITTPLLVVAGVALLIGGFLYLKKGRAAAPAVA